MKALRYHGNKDIRLDEIPEPELKPGWVKIKNAWAGVCGSDLHEFLVGPKNAPTKPHVITGETIPTVLGHEWSGTIVALGPDIPKSIVAENNLAVGKKCVIFPILGDRTCSYCREHLHGACPNWGFLGYSGFGGGFAEYCCVDARDVVVIPDDMRLDVAALVEPIAVGWHAVKLSEVKPDDAVLVMGSGPIGIAVILSLQAHGVSNISVSEVSPLRAEQAKNAGARYVFNPKEDDVVQRSKEVSADGFGPRVVYECAGVQATMEVAINAVRGAGTIVNIGIFEKELTLNWNLLNRRSLRYLGSNTYTIQEMREVVAAIADGSLKQPEMLITGRISLEEGVEKGINALIHEREKHVKILIGVDDGS